MFDQPASPNCVISNGDKEMQHSPTESGIEETAPTQVKLPKLGDIQPPPQLEPTKNLNGEVPVNDAENIGDKVPDATEEHTEQVCFW